MADKGHEVHYLANGYTGATIKNATLMDGTEFNYTIYGNSKAQYFADIMSGHLKNTKTDFFYILLDTFMLHGNNAWFLNVDTSPAQTAFWYPSDGGGGMPVGCHRILEKVEHPVGMSEFAKKQVHDYYGIKKATVIPHGTEPERFYKLPDDQRTELRVKWGLHDKFVVGVVARNQPRKMLDRTMKAFYHVKDKIPNAVLLMHLDPSDQAAVWNIRNIISRYNLENRVMFTGMNALKGFDWNQMNEVYNLMDIFFLSTSGEGFGIPIIEAMSCEVPVVATDYTTTPELVTKNKAGMAVKLAGVPEIDLWSKHSKDYDNAVMNGTMTGSWEVERGSIDVIDAANKITYLAANPKVREEMGQNGRKAVLEKYDFNKVIGPAWEKLVLQSVK